MDVSDIIAQRAEHIEKLFDFLAKELKDFGLDSMGNELRTLHKSGDTTKVLELKLRLKTDVPDGLRKLWLNGGGRKASEINHILNNIEDLQDLVNEYIGLTTHKIELDSDNSEVDKAILNIDNTLPNILRECCEYLPTYRYPFIYENELYIIHLKECELQSIYKIDLMLFNEYGCELNKYNIDCSHLYLWVENGQEVKYKFDSKVKENTKEFMLHALGAWLLHIGNFKYDYLSIFKNI